MWVGDDDKGGEGEGQRARRRWHFWGGLGDCGNGEGLAMLARIGGSGEIGVGQDTVAMFSFAMGNAKGLVRGGPLVIASGGWGKRVGLGLERVGIFLEFWRCTTKKL